MIEVKNRAVTHPSEAELADYLSGALSAEDRARLEAHMAGCDDCLTAIVAARDAVGPGLSKRKGFDMKKFNLYLAGAIAAFILSFAVPRFFLQFLVATLLLGIKWITDQKATKMLIMIHEAWKKDGETGASRILKALDEKPKSRI